MAISGVSEATLVQPNDSVGKKELERSDFMTLFITQLQYQDPMKPMDSYEMASQLAQFSNMEATTKMSDNMEKLLEYQTSQNNLQLLTLLNTQVQVSGNMIAVVDGETTPTQFTLEDAADTVTIEVYDQADHKVWQEDLGPQKSGDYELEWDGNNMVGDLVADGAYQYKVKAYTQAGQQVVADYRSTGTVTGVNFDSGTAMLTIDDYVEASVADVVSVK